MGSLCRDSSQFFLGSFLIFSSIGVLNYSIDFSCEISLFIIAITGIAVFALSWIWCDHETFQYAWRSSMLGSLFSLGFYIFFSSPPQIKIFGLYVSVMAFFHFTEFLTIAIIHPNQVSVDSFVLNHSPQYTLAAISSWIEFFVEAYFFPGLKQYFYVSYSGLAICIAGEILRKSAMLTAGRSFNHLVQSRKAKDHVLVTNGIYSYFRHPSYVGWFYWAIGSQILLLNPVCIPVYAVVSWMFFRNRIFIEEITLLNFFGQNYVEYQKKVGTGIPFVKGYRI